MPRRTKTAANPESGGDPFWYKDAVIYEVHVRAYRDSNGDGVGDFRGLMQKLDYIQDLGVTALWLLPFYPSPLRDDGYDIANYTDIHPLYGNLTDFKAFLREAHARGMQVITELVVNHTSDQHPWFQAARRARPGSAARNYYVWSGTSDRYAEARIIFKDFEPSNWTWDAGAGGFYWHRFYAHQPDLNYDEPHVHKALSDALDFWLGLGVDGLRLDAVPYLYEREGTNCENLPETHAFLKDLRRHVDQKFRNRMLLAEANQWPEDAVAYFGAGDECHMAFHFPVMPRLFMSIRMEDRLPILDILQQTPAIPENCQWALFLRNHDELTLEMVTDEDRDYMYRVYAQDPQARINLGIRRRLAPLLENHRAKIELMNALLFSLPGTPVIYYGDEIGMGDNIYLGDRNGVRTPMQWSPDRNAGFSKANPQRLYLPVVIDPGYHYEAINVETQQSNPHSLLWWMKRLIGLRKRFRALGRGTLEFLHPDNHKVLAFVRQLGDERLLVVANLSRFAQCTELDLSRFRGLMPVELLGRTPFPAIGERPYFLTLGAYAFYWFALEPERVESTGPTPQPETRPSRASLPVVDVSERWEEVLQGKARQALQDVLPGYLNERPWFAGHSRQTEAAMIVETIPIPHDGQAAQLALIQVEYSEGDSETYLLPLACAFGEQKQRLLAARPEAVIAEILLRTNGQAETGALYDPLGEHGFSSVLAESILRRRRFRRPGGELVAIALRGAGSPSRLGTPPGECPNQATADQAAPTPASPLLANGAPVCEERSNTLVTFGDRWTLKVFRRIEEGLNPEIEAERFLLEQTSFRNIPALAGMLEYRRSWGQPMTLAVLQDFVEHQTDGWQFTRDSLSRYFEQVAVGQQEGVPEALLPRQPAVELAEQEIPALAQHKIGSFLEAVHLLGRRTGELHLALASACDDPSFAPETLTALHQRSLYQSLRSQIRQAFQRLRRRLAGLPLDDQEAARKLLEREEDIIHRGWAIQQKRIGALQTRCHGDYHLGQVLYTGRDFIIIDLEGRAERPLSARRRKHSPLRDVASMLRSFHYAIQFALHGNTVRPQDVPILEPWARFWYLWVAARFLKSYLEVARQGSFLPDNRDQLNELLYFYLLKRAVLELRQELEAGGERVAIPLAGLTDLVNGG
jgi:maltose alpha-D-glucosyltransferase / alpha-amylase